MSPPAEEPIDKIQRDNQVNMKSFSGAKEEEIRATKIRVHPFFVPALHVFR